MSARRVSGRFLWALAAITAAGGLAAFALPVVGVLRGNSQQFQAPTSGFQRANVLYRRATGQSVYYGVQAVLRADARSAGSVSADRAVSMVESQLMRQRGFQRLTEVAAPGSRGNGEKVVMAAFADEAASVAAAGRLRQLTARGGMRLQGWRMLIGGPDIAFHELDARTVAVAERVELLAGVLLLHAFARNATTGGSQTSKRSPPVSRALAR